MRWEAVSRLGREEDVRALREAVVENHRLAIEASHIIHSLHTSLIIALRTNLKLR